MKRPKALQTISRVATQREDEVDALIQKHAQNWRLERMPVVDRNLLRAAIAEMLGYPKTPTAVIINETLEIARRYAAPESINFLNGVLEPWTRTAGSAPETLENAQQPRQRPSMSRAFAFTIPQNTRYSSSSDAVRAVHRRKARSGRQRKLGVIRCLWPPSRRQSACGVGQRKQVDIVVG